MKTWFMMWMFASALIGYVEVIEFGADDQPWAAHAFAALLIGGVLAAVPGCLAVIAGLP